MSGLPASRYCNHEKGVIMTTATVTLHYSTGDITATIYEVVDYDQADDRVYLRTFEGGEVFCVRPQDITVQKEG